MAKIAFTKLGLKLNKEIKTITWDDQEIEIKQYLPANEKLEMIGRIINNSADDMKFYNIGKIEIFTALEFIFTYTNINFTEKQREDICKLYDILISSGFYNAVIEEIPEEEREWIEEVTMDTIQSIYSYQNSIMGILDAVSQDYDNLGLEASDIHNKLANPENLALLKTVMAKLG